jgi:hypothetical protein
MQKKTLLIAAAVLCLSWTFWLRAQESGAPSRGKGVLDVIVLDEQDKPLAGVLVAVPGYRSTTGLGGTCRFALLPGRYAVLVSKSGYRGRRINAGVRPGETTTLRVALQKLPPAPSPRS